VTFPKVPGVLPVVLIVGLLAGIQSMLGRMTTVTEAWAYLGVILLTALAKWIQITWGDGSGAPGVRGIAGPLSKTALWWLG
jgi:hypothetical protein